MPPGRSSVCGSLPERDPVDLTRERVTNAFEAPPAGRAAAADDGPATISLSEVRYRRRLGGLLKSYSRVAA